MKRKSYVKPIAVCAMVCSMLLSGCGASGITEDAAVACPEPMMEYQAKSAPAEAANFNGEIGLMDECAEPVQISMPTERKIVKHSNLSLETKEYDDALPKLIEVVESAGGYIESQNTNGRSIRDDNDYYTRSVQINARIPADKMEQVTTSVGELCNIVSRSDSMDDITDTYFDTDAHLNVLEQQEKKLLELLSKAEELEDVISLETALSDVRYQIESLTASIKRMDNQVTYSYLGLYLEEVGEYNQPMTTPKNFGDRISASFKRSIAHVKNSIQNVVLFLVEAVPSILFWGLIFAVIVLAVYKLSRRMGLRKPLFSKSAKHNAKKPDTQSKDE